MTPGEFIATFPCLEQINGFLWGTRNWSEENYGAALEVIEPYRLDLLKGKVVPGRTHDDLAYTYVLKRKPRLKAGRTPVDIETTLREMASERHTQIQERG